MCACFPTVVVLAEEPPEEPSSDALVFFKHDKTAEVPVIMYHLVTKNGKLVGRYGITPEELAQDLQYLRDNDYETVVMADLINFVYRGKPLPPKCVMLTFDDGNFSDYLYLYPLLKTYGQKAVVSIIGKETDRCTELAAKQANKNGRYPNLTWAQVKEMKDSGRVEIQSHSYDLHGALGSAKRRDESVEAYRARLGEDLSQLQSRCKEELRWKPTTFTYPLGMISESSRETLNGLGFNASFSCCEGVNQLQQGDPECLFRLKRNIRPSGRSLEQVLKRLS